MPARTEISSCGGAGGATPKYLALSPTLLAWVGARSNQKFTSSVARTTSSVARNDVVYLSVGSEVQVESTHCMRAALS